MSNVVDTSELISINVMKSYEDFLTYKEYESTGNYITVTSSNRIDVVSQPQFQYIGYVRRPLLPSPIGDFHIEFKFIWTGDGVPSTVGLFGLSDASMYQTREACTIADLDNTNQGLVFSCFQSSEGILRTRLASFECLMDAGGTGTGVADSTYYDIPAMNVPYWIVVTRTGFVVDCYWYTDATHMTLARHRSFTQLAKYADNPTLVNTYSRVYAQMSYFYGSTTSVSSVIIENLLIL